MNLLYRDKKSLFTYCSSTVHVFKNIKNRFHDTIYKFKYYFATVFSVFIFSKNKFNLNEPLIEGLEIELGSQDNGPESRELQYK